MRPRFVKSPKVQDPIYNVQARDSSVPTSVHEGSESRYWLGCRCENCYAVVRAVRLKRIPADPAKHGTTTIYGYGCRCEPCRDAMAAYNHARISGAGRGAPGRPRGPRLKG